jgi:predicted TIM-barrel fold metal-dependent hydrolase
MIIDSHCHIFTHQIIDNIARNPPLFEELKLDVVQARQRLEPAALDRSAVANNLEICLLLPSTGPAKVKAENDRFMKIAAKSSRLRTLATLHPMMADLADEVRRVFQLGIYGFKLSSFSQRFSLCSDEIENMLSSVERIGSDSGIQPVMVLDTFTRADIHFGAHRDHLTTPVKLRELCLRHPAIRFVGSHMGGLAADFNRLRRYLTPSANLYLDTSNAAHTLEQAQFIELLKTHGSSKIMFGTDWPWFHHAAEIPKIRGLLDRAGYSPVDQAAVFGENARKLFKL